MSSSCTKIVYLTIKDAGPIPSENCIRYVNCCGEIIRICGFGDGENIPLIGDCYKIFEPIEEINLSIINISYDFKSECDCTSITPLPTPTPTKKFTDFPSPTPKCSCRITNINVDPYYLELANENSDYNLNGVVFFDVLLCGQKTYTTIDIRLPGNHTYCRDENSIKNNLYYYFRNEKIEIIDIIGFDDGCCDEILPEITPTALPTTTPRFNPTPTKTPSPSPTNNITLTPLPTLSPTLTIGPTPTPTPTKTPEPTPCLCKKSFVTVTAQDLLVASGNTLNPQWQNTIFISILNCFEGNQNQFIPISSPGTYEICNRYMNYPTDRNRFFYYKNNDPVKQVSRGFLNIVNTTQCCTVTGTTPPFPTAPMNEECGCYNISYYCNSNSMSHPCYYELYDCRINKFVVNYAGVLGTYNRQLKRCFYLSTLKTWADTVFTDIEYITGCSSCDIVVPTPTPTPTSACGCYRVQYAENIVPYTGNCFFEYYNCNGTKLTGSTQGINTNPVYVCAQQNSIRTINCNGLMFTNLLSTNCDCLPTPTPTVSPTKSNLNLTLTPTPSPSRTLTPTLTGSTPFPTTTPAPTYGCSCVKVKFRIIDIMGPLGPFFRYKDCRNNTITITGYNYNDITICANISTIETNQLYNLEYLNKSCSSVSDCLNLITPTPTKRLSPTPTPTPTSTFSITLPVVTPPFPTQTLGPILTPFPTDQVVTIQPLPTLSPTLTPAPTFTPLPTFGCSCAFVRFSIIDSINPYFKYNDCQGNYIILSDFYYTGLTICVNESTIKTNRSYTLQYLNKSCNSVNDCFSSVTLTPTRTPIPTNTPTPTPSKSPTPTKTPSPSPTRTQTPTPSPSPLRPTATPKQTPYPTRKPKPTPLPTLGIPI